MCTHKKYVTNRYTGQRLLVNCGHCKSCLQEKANRNRNRIRAALPDNMVFLFVCLTYDEKYIPYIKKSELNDTSKYEFNLYRDYSARFYKGRIISSPLVGADSVLTTIPCVTETGEINREYLEFVPNMYKKGRGYHSEKMALIYYKDVQNFFKRLRQNLSRMCPTSPSIRAYTTSEYGETHFRPHFHTLIGTERENYDIVRRAVLLSWPFADRTDLERNIKPARDAASYVAAYVNCGANISKSFERLSRPKHSCSKNFGVELPSFRLDKILENADKGLMCYSRERNINGTPTVFDVPIPKYVINRYFPQFKGLCRLSPDSLACVLRFPEKYIYQHKDEAITNYIDDDKHHDTHATFVRLTNAFKKYHSITGRNIFDYSIDYQRVWNCYKTTLYKLMFEDEDVSMFELYDNIEDFWNGFIRNDTLTSLAYGKVDLQCDSNKFKRTRQLSNYYSELYDKKCKTSRVNNFIYTNSLNRNL